LENRYSTSEDNILKDIEAVIIVLGHNWNTENVLAIQKQTLNFFGFKVINDLSWGWQFSSDASEESNDSYKKDTEKFKEVFG